MRCSDIKVVLILIAMLVSIAVGEVAVLAACLAFSACVDEKRFRILFKERRQLTGIIEGLQVLSSAQTNEIKKLQEQLTGTIEGLQQLSTVQTNAIKELREMSRQVKNEVNAQMGEIVALRRENRRLRGEVEELGWTGWLSFVFTIAFGALGVLSAFGILEFIILKVTESFR